MKIVKINAMWCSACISMYKIWKEIETKYPEIEIVTYDYDIDEDEIKKFNVGDVLPVAILYKDDEEITRLNGEKTLKEIEEMIEKGVK